MYEVFLSISKVGMYLYMLNIFIFSDPGILLREGYKMHLIFPVHFDHLLVATWGMC